MKGRGGGCQIRDISSLNEIYKRQPLSCGLNCKMESIIYINFYLWIFKSLILTNTFFKCKPLTLQKIFKQPAQTYLLIELPLGFYQWNGLDKISIKWIKYTRHYKPFLLWYAYYALLLQDRGARYRSHFLVGVVDKENQKGLQACFIDKSQPTPPSPYRMVSSLAEARYQWTHFQWEFVACL